ncbi:tyrosine-type recombinase/integrase [Roseomonas sp. PWR1]|uniref:Tyrosine-type recombinase/integrase n=1 Tax=Roseomonas nitratireducens TaxID=2820810 RepID=A0ABS4AX84_9PROT|nr:tyrosine-type recombinase/integrase [Neoroseomonas nitratireducens]MBP0465980.1 tyrosine-type recombinase/integrase [Neoroseomonas nitratireducens]
MASVERRITVAKGGGKITRWLCRWSETQDGERRQRVQTFGTKQEAMDCAARMTGLEARGIPATARMTFRQHVDLWLAACAATRKPATVEHYRQKIGMVLPHLGHLELRKIGVEHVEEAVRKAAIGQGGRPLAPRTVHHVHAVLRNCLGDAKRLRRINDNPARDARAPSVPRKRMTAPTLDEIAAMADAARDAPTRTLILLAGLTGMRRGELAALRWSAVDFAERWISVHAVIEQAGRADTARLREGAKTEGSVRRIAMSAAVEGLLRAHRAHEAELALACGVRLPSDAYLFHQPSGFSDHWTPSALTAKAARARDAAAVRREVQPLHGARHRYATSLMGVVPDSLLAAALGHSDPRTTRAIYQRAEEAGERATADAADAALGGLLRRPGR